MSEEEEFDGKGLHCGNGRQKKKMRKEKATINRQH